jgi:hypothetical protein
MAKAKSKRWVCPNCKKGKLGKIRPRKNDIIRYCFPCSTKSGYLIERTSPADERKRGKKKAAGQQKLGLTAAFKEAAQTNQKWLQKKRWIYPYREGHDKTRLVAVEAQNVHTTGAMCLQMGEEGEALFKQLCKVSNYPDSTPHRNALRKIKERYATFSAAYHGTPSHAINVMKMARIMALDGNWPNAIIRKEMIRLWKNTQKAKGGHKRDFTIRLSRAKVTEWKFPTHTSGRAGKYCGVAMTCSVSIGSIMVTMLHELCHIAQLGKFPRINRVTRPHDLAFNQMQCDLAKLWWGYDFSPRAGGYSVGKGYAPTRHLEKWLKNEIRVGNPTITEWIKKCK